jgi:DNA polymerase-3 subunit epsilon
MTLGISISFDDEKGIIIGGIPKTVRDKKGKSLLGFPNDYIVLDLETTGLDPMFDEIIEIAAMKFEKNEKVDVFTSFVKPEEEIDDFITKLTGITNDMVANAPSIKDIIPNLNSFLKNNVIVAHNANFDINFLYDNYVTHLNKPFSNDFIDTMRISRRLFKNMRHRLIDLCGEFQIDVDVTHRAEADCEVTQRVYQYMRNHCTTNGIDLNTIGGSASGRSFNLKDFKPGSHELDESHPIYGKTVCFTGKLERFQRKDALQIVTNIGGIPADSVTTNTNILVLGNNDYCKTIKDGKSSKQKKAEERIIDGQDLIIINEKVFYDML